MKLRQVYDALQHLHLQSLALSNEGAGLAGIDYPQINMAINQTLTDIYTDFNVESDELFLRIIPNRTFYKLTSEFADSNAESTQLYRWIMDTPSNPFKDEDIKYIKYITGNCTGEIQLNEHNYCNSAYTPSPNVLQVSQETICHNQYLSLVYAKNPTLLPITTDLNPDGLNLAIPQNMFNLLIKGTCSFIFGAKGGKDMYYKGLQYKQEYEQEKINLRNLGFYNDNYTDNEHFKKDGWV